MISIFNSKWKATQYNTGEIEDRVGRNVQIWPTEENTKEKIEANLKINKT